MQNLYDFITFSRKTPVSKYNWVANLRWYAMETENALDYQLKVVPKNRNIANTEYGSISNKTVADIKVDGWNSVNAINYNPDKIETVTDNMTFTLSMPWIDYASVISITEPKAPCTVSFIVNQKAKIEALDNTIVCTDGDYSFVYKHNASATVEGNVIKFTATEDAKIVIAFYDNEARATACANRIFGDTDATLTASRNFWEEFLQSCPLISIDENFVYNNEFAGITETYTPDQVKARQLWQFAIALCNMNKIDFNDQVIYMAPDLNNWFGTWSNDGPETLAALSVTNAKALVRECIVEYFRCSITKEGIHSWYTHNNGVGCYDNPGDVGILSHGVPNIIHTVDFYIRHTNDASILDAVCDDNMTVWDKLKKYIERIFPDRDINGDGLIETTNLWESGWDDRIGDFFKGATLEEWIENIGCKTPEQIAAFYEAKSYPIISVVEQVYMLWALKSMAKMAKIKGDAELERQCLDKYDATIAKFTELLWNEEEGFYYDYNVRDDKPGISKNADTFYYLYFEKDPHKVAKILEKLTDKEEFGLYYLPMSSKKNPGFSELGYWSGGHWPREMGYVSIALNECGQSEKAKEIAIRALCSNEGNIFNEVKNPITGEPTTPVVKMAYNVMVNVGLLQIDGQVEW